MKFQLKRTVLAVAIVTQAYSLQAEEVQTQNEDENENVIIVTATRRAEDAQKVPISITTLDGEQMERSGIKNINDLAAHVPNFNINTSNQTTNARITIRGVGSVGNNAIEGSVGVFIDGVYFPRPGSVLGNLLDIQSVEVLRGPQGTLFGRNTPMGALNITTNDPSDDFTQKYNISAGNFGAYNVGATVSGGITDTASALISVNYTERDGYGFNELTDSEIGDKDDLSVRAKLLVDVTDNFEAKITADFSEANHTGQIVEIVEETNNPVFQGTTQALYGAAAGTGATYDRIVNQQNDDDANDQQWGVSLQLKTELNDFEYKSITAIRDWENTYSNEGTLRITADMLPRNSFYQTDTLSQEFQILSPDSDTFEWVGGLFYYQEDYDIVSSFDAGSDFCIPTIFATIRGQLLAAGMDLATASSIALGQATTCASLPQSDVGVANFEQELDSIAVFAQGTYHFSDKLSGTAGLRWTKDEKTASFVQVLNNPFAAAIRIPESSPNLAFDDSKMTWLANLNYQFDDTLLGFFNMATGFKSGGFNSQGAATDISDRRAFDSETTENIELGIKSSWLDDDLTANITFYRTDITDFQDRSFDGLSFLTSNAGELRQQGVEVDFKANLNDSFRIFGGFSFLDSKFLDYQNASPLPGGVGTQNLTGRPNHRAPRWQGNLTIDWSMPLGDNLDLFVRPSYSYVSEANLGGDTNLNPQTVQAGYGLLSLRTGVEDFASGWRLEAYVDNATDKGYCGGMFDQPFGAQLGAVNAANNTTVIRCVVGSPRTYGIKFSYSY